MHRAMERMGISSILERAKRTEAYYGDREGWDRAIRAAAHADATERAEQGEDEAGAGAAGAGRGGSGASPAGAAGAGDAAPAVSTDHGNSTEGALAAPGEGGGAQWADTASPLRRLDIAFCWRVTDAGLRAVAPACANLRMLNLSSCSGLGGDAIAGCLRAARATLEDVQLRVRPRACPRDQCRPVPPRLRQPLRLLQPRRRGV